jgi:hypothetical protein
VRSSAELLAPFAAGNRTGPSRVWIDKVSSEPEATEAEMSLLSRILGLRSAEPPKRVRICVECGMPVEEHKEWCSILRTRQAMEQRRLSTAVSQD